MKGFPSCSFKLKSRYRSKRVFFQVLSTWIIMTLPQNVSCVITCTPPYNSGCSRETILGIEMQTMICHFNSKWVSVFQYLRKIHQKNTPTVLLSLKLFKKNTSWYRCIVVKKPSLFLVHGVNFGCFSSCHFVHVMHVFAIKDVCEILQYWLLRCLVFIT